MTKPGPSSIGRWLREPAVHFVLIGLALFVLHHAVAPRPETPRIEVSEAMVEALREDHVRRTGALPNGAEEQALIAQFVNDEVLYREALSLGLDRGDPVVRRRLIQKMTFLTEDLAQTGEPSRTGLEAYLQAQRERYLEPERFSLSHVFVSLQGGSERADAEARRLLEALRAGADPAGVGDAFIHGYRFSNRNPDDLDGRFGPGFAEQLADLPVGVWSGPVRSSYGLHLVRLDSHRPRHLPDLAEVESQVRRDWLADRRRDLNRQALQRLRERYDVRVAAGPGPQSARTLEASLGVGR